MYDKLTPLIGLWARFKDYVFMATGAALLVTSAGWYITSVRLDGARADLTAEEEGRRADAEGYRRAQAEYTSKAIAEKAEQERLDNERKAEADLNYATLLNQYRDAIRVRRSYTPTGGTSGGDNLPSPTSGTGSNAGAPTNSVVPATEYLMISWDDADICAENTAKVVTFYEWARQTTKED